MDPIRAGKLGWDIGTGFAEMWWGKSISADHIARGFECIDAFCKSTTYDLTFIRTAISHFSQITSSDKDYMQAAAAFGLAKCYGLLDEYSEAYRYLDIVDSIEIGFFTACKDTLRQTQEESIELRETLKEWEAEYKRRQRNNGITESFNGNIWKYFSFLLVAVLSGCLLYMCMSSSADSANETSTSIESQGSVEFQPSPTLDMPKSEQAMPISKNFQLGSYLIPLSDGIIAQNVSADNLEAMLCLDSSVIGSVSVEYIPDEEYDLKAHCKSLSEAFIDAPLAWSKVKNRNIMFVTIADPSAPNIYHAYLYCGHYKGEQISMKLCSSVGNDAVVRKFFENVVANISYQERISLLDNEEQNDSQSNIITTGDPNDSIIATYETSNGMVSYVIKKTDSYDPDYFFSYDHSSNSYHSFAENLEKEMAMSFKEAKAIGQYIYLIANNMGSGIGNTDIVLKFDSNTETFEHVFGGGVAKFVEENKIECTEYEISIPEGGCNADATYNYTTRIIDM